VTQTFSFQGGEAVAVSVTIRNNTDREVAAGLRFLLDTYLGEAGFPHFRTERDREINGELSFTGAEVPAWWLSRSSRASRSPENPGLLMPLRGEGITTPDRLILANWKRLAEASWLYETAPGAKSGGLCPRPSESDAVVYKFPPHSGARTTESLGNRKWRPSFVVVEMDNSFNLPRSEGDFFHENILH